MTGVTDEPLAVVAGAGTMGVTLTLGDVQVSVLRTVSVVRQPIRAR